MALKLVSSFPNRLKEALCETQITDFANKIGLSKQAISAYTLGTRKPKAPTISVIAVALNVSESWLMGYDVPKERSDLFIAAKDIPDFLKKSLTDEKSIFDLLSMFLAPDEMDVIIKYKQLDDKGKKVSLALNNVESAIIHNYRSLNEEGQEKIVEYIDDIAQSSKYKKLDQLCMGDEENAKQA